MIVIALPTMGSSSSSSKESGIFLKTYILQQSSSIQYIHARTYTFYSVCGHLFLIYIVIEIISTQTVFVEIN